MKRIKISDIMNIELTKEEILVEDRFKDPEFAINLHLRLMYE